MGKGKSRVPSQLARKGEAELVRRPTIPLYVKTHGLRKIVTPGSSTSFAADCERSPEM